MFDLASLQNVAAPPPMFRHNEAKCTTSLFNHTVVSL